MNEIMIHLPAMISHPAVVFHVILSVFNLFLSDYEMVLTLTLTNSREKNLYSFLRNI